MSIAGDIADERCEHQIKLLEAKILSYRQIFEKLVNDTYYKMLKEILYVYTEEQLIEKYGNVSKEKLIDNLLKIIDENPNLIGFDEHFGIKIDVKGKI